jgi:imidazoleglycerol phosphate dehydratase HisB
MLDKFSGLSHEVENEKRSRLSLMYVDEALVIVKYKQTKFSTLIEFFQHMYIYFLREIAISFDCSCRENYLLV